MMTKINLVHIRNSNQPLLQDKNLANDSCFRDKNDTNCTLTNLPLSLK